MPTKKEREYYRMGFQDGTRYSAGVPPLAVASHQVEGLLQGESYRFPPEGARGLSTIKPRKRKLSAWNKYVKANSNKPRFRYRNGKLNLKKMGVAFRKTPAGRKKR